MLVVSTVGNVPFSLYLLSDSHLEAATIIIKIYGIKIKICVLSVTPAIVTFLESQPKWDVTN